MTSKRSSGQRWGMSAALLIGNSPIRSLIDPWCHTTSVCRGIHRLGGGQVHGGAKAREVPLIVYANAMLDAGDDD